MLIELKLCLQPEALDTLSARDLAQLAEDVDLPQAREAVRVAVEFAHGQTDPTDYLTVSSTTERRALVIVSPKLADPARAGCKASCIAQQVLETSWNRRIVVGLVGVTDLPDDEAIGLDAVVAPEHLKRDLREVFKRLARRLWFKLAPPQAHRPASAERPDWQVRLVRDKATFRDCLALRHLVYSSLGYLDSDIAESQIKLDLDCYDTRARQFVVIDRTAGRVAATARLISPGTSPIQRGFDQAPRYEDWCNAFAREESDRVYRDVLKRRNIASLPIVDSFHYFLDLSDHEKYAYPRYACELSRVVVHPDYRGYGILRMLMSKAVKEARKDRKKYLMLECAPFHESMYQKFGFVTIEKDGQRHYTRAQRLDSWAVAMHLELNGNDRVGAVPNAFRILVERPAELQLNVEISDPELGELDIESRLREPFVPLRNRQHVANRVAKGGHGPLLAHLRLGLNRPDHALCDVLRELRARLPNAAMRLISGSRVLPIADPGCPGDSACRSLLNEMNDWLEKLDGTE